MNCYVMTLFPEMVEQGMRTSILGKAMEKGLLTLEAVNIRDYTKDRHKKTDDYPYGGGAGMLMQAQPVFDCYRAIAERIKEGRAAGGGAEKAAEGFPHASETGSPACTARVIYLTPQGRLFSQKMARELSKEENLIFLCGQDNFNQPEETGKKQPDAEDYHRRDTYRQSQKKGKYHKKRE